MNCGWCGANADGSGSHGICQECEDKMLLQSAWRQLERTPSLVEVNALQLAAECEELLSKELATR